MKYIVRPDDAAAAPRLGAKAATLATMQAHGLPVPAWIVLAPEAFSASAATSTADPAAGSGEIAVLPCSGVLHELQAALATLCPGGELVAVRSSATDEDGARRSFAGQYDSFLSVQPSDVPCCVAGVWRSGLGERVRRYRAGLGLRGEPCIPAVLIQRMVNADLAGVAFSADPVSGQRSIAIVEAVPGLGAALATGSCDGDRYSVDRLGQIVARSIGSSSCTGRASHSSGEVAGAQPVAPGPEQATALSDEQVRTVALLARRAARVAGRAQDIEWAIEDGRLWLLQARPITSLTQVADPDGARILWDNSNIAESYGGVTTPLTFTFASHAYDQAYRRLCRVLRMSPGAVANNDETFRHMLGLIHGRIYYNLGSWYCLLALLPGFKVNRRFMEGMMGVHEGLPPGIATEIEATGLGDRLRDAARLPVALGSLLAGYVLLPRRIRRFHRHIEQTLGDQPDPRELRADELAGCYHELERKLIARWDTPLLNDLFTMIFFGLLNMLTLRWCHDGAGSLQNDLLSDESGTIATDPARRMRELAAVAAGQPDLVEALCDRPLPAVDAALAIAPEFRRLYHAYLERFADRCLDELKLESPTLRDDPLILLRSVGRLAASGRIACKQITERHTAEQTARTALHGHPVRRAIFACVLRNARKHIRARENLRFERTRVFGRARLLFVEIGKRFEADGLLDSARDIFYLEVREILGMIAGTTTTTDLRGLAALRKAEFARYRQADPPADRFETRGCVHVGNAFHDPAPAAEPTGDSRIGIGCSSGIVRGRARVVDDPAQAAVQSGDILIAGHTDPGWVILFPIAGGVVVEHGGLLSHAAIVARELGVPAIVGLRGAMRWLRDGDWVEMDGSSGRVTLLASPAKYASSPEVAEAAHV
jgi:phosphohistidine swiveling domain-containing protein